MPLGGGGGARGADASPAGFALTPPSSDAPGAAAWVTAEGALRVRAYEPAVAPATDRSGAARGNPTPATPTRQAAALAKAVAAPTSGTSSRAASLDPVSQNTEGKNCQRARVVGKSLLIWLIVSAKGEAFLASDERDLVRD